MTQKPSERIVQIVREFESADPNPNLHGVMIKAIVQYLDEESERAQEFIQGFSLDREAK